MVVMVAIPLLLLVPTNWIIWGIGFFLMLKEGGITAAELCVELRCMNIGGREKVKKTGGRGAGRWARARTCDLRRELQPWHAPALHEHPRRRRPRAEWPHRAAAGGGGGASAAVSASRAIRASRASCADGRSGSERNRARTAL
jgi:hypothetical protein